MVNIKHKTLVSLGMSCQTAHQIRRLIQGQKTGKESPLGVSAPSGIFDWLICPPASIIDLLNRRIPDFAKDQISVKNNRAYWADFRIYFWHNFLGADHQSRQVLIDETFEQELTRWRYLRNRFATINPAKTIFVLSNTQNNLGTEVFGKTEPDQYYLTETLIDDLRLALASYFNTIASNIHLQVLTRPELFRGSGNNASINFIPLDHNEWKGSNKSWDHWWRQLSTAQNK